MADGNELLPCPFCGGEAEVVRQNCGWDVECDDCGIISPAGSYEAAIKFWNSRVHPKDVQVAIGRAIPKKPYDVIECYVYREGKCPSCKSTVKNREKICRECGHRLDWSEE